MSKRQSYRRKRGFTLFEVIIALTIAGTVLGVLAVTIVDAMNSRHEAAQLQTAVFLAEQTMNKIKTTTDDSSDQGEFEDFPGYSYEYTIEEDELDVFELLGGGGANDEEGDQNDRLTYRQERGQFQESASGFINLKMKKYKVIIHYGDNLTYTLHMARGTQLSYGQ